MTREEAIKAYTEKFGGFPDCVMMGASDGAITAAVEKALKSGEELEPEEGRIY